jgi:hypothetical protein
MKRDDDTPPPLIDATDPSGEPRFGASDPAPPPTEAEALEAERLFSSFHVPPRRMEPRRAERPASNGASNGAPAVAHSALPSAVVAGAPARATVLVELEALAHLGRGAESSEDGSPSQVPIPSAPVLPAPPRRTAARWGVVLVLAGLLVLGAFVGIALATRDAVSKPDVLPSLARSSPAPTACASPADPVRPMKSASTSMPSPNEPPTPSAAPPAPTAAPTPAPRGTVAPGARSSAPRPIPPRREFQPENVL